MNKDFIPQFQIPEKGGDNTSFLSMLFGKDSDFQPIMARAEELTKTQERKVSLFEKGLEHNLRATDTIDDAVRKVVKVALAAEFGISLVKAKGANNMVETIVRGIMGDPLLRKQALLIIDRYTGTFPKPTVAQGSTKKH